MFRLESYITPLLMGYIDKYVKLNKEDFQLSLWGGDVVLNKVDLRLDVIEEALSIPIAIKSGFIHELRIHVPWTRIYSEPVVITVNTIECILKLRGGSSSEDLETASSKSDASVTKRPVMQPIRAAKVDEVDLPPGYIQSLINKIIHNVNIVINNLILKFVEDDIVLSLNVKSAECYSVNSEWKRSFVELMMPELMLRRILDFHDLTVCLDKRNADGKIESYQEPVFYRCALLARMLMHYETLNSKLPQLVKLNILCEKLDMSLTNVQLPMFYRLIDLCLALYYGTIEVPEDARKKVPTATTVELPQDISQVDLVQLEEGWISWMWSYVPAVLPVDENASEELEDSGGTRLTKKSDVTVFILGFYITEASILLKVYELVHSSSVFASVKLVAKPYLLWEFSGLCMEMKMRGNDFTDVQFGIQDSRLSVCDRITRSADGESKEKEGVFFKCSRDVLNPFQLTYISGSLFDADSPENNGQISMYVFDEKEYLETYNEATALQRFGIFWMSYLFTLVDKKDKTLIRFLVGPSHLIVSSIPAERVRKVLDILLNPEHESYSQPRKARSEQDLKSATDEDLEKFSDPSATVVYRLTVLRPIVTIHEADVNDVSNRRHSRRMKDSELMRQADGIHPVIVVEAQTVEMEITIPLYARQVVDAGFKRPTDLLLDSFYSRLSLKLVKLEASLASVYGTSSSMSSGVSTILQPSTVLFSKQSLMFPEFWRNPLLPQQDMCLETEDGVMLSIMKPQMLLFLYIVSSWMQSLSENAALTVKRSLMDDVFMKNSGNRLTMQQQQQQHPVIEFCVTNLHLRHLNTEAVHSLTARVSTVQVLLHGIEDESEFTVPLLSGPLDVSNIFSKRLFKSQDSQQLPCKSKGDLLQLTFQIPKDAATIQAPAAMYVDCRGIVVCLDPRLHAWLSYKPSPKEPSPGAGLGVALNPNIANATLPLMQRSPQGSESDRSVNESTESRTSFRGSHLQTPSSNRISRTSVEKRISDTEPTKNEDAGHQVASWGSSFAGIFPFVKILELQVNMENWCFFFPSQPLRSAEPSVHIGSIFRDLFIRRSLPDTIVVCCPAVYVSSAGRKKSEGFVEIPVKSLDHSIASEKLPWTLRLTNCSIYSIHESRSLWNLIKPMSVGATLAVITKYQMPPLESLAHLGLCFHMDLDSIRILCSNRQFQLVYSLLTDFASSTSDLLTSLQLVTNLFNSAQNPDECSTQNLESKTPEGLKVTNNASSVFDSAALTNDSEIARTVSEDTSADFRFEESGNVRLTFWLQCTLTRLSVQLFALNEKGNEICVKSDLEDIAVAVDVQDVYSKAKCKFGSIGISHYVNMNDIWTTGDHEGILVFCTHQFKNSGPVIHHQRTLKSREFLSADPASGADAKAFSGHSHGFLDFIYTRARTESAARKLSSTFDGLANCDKPSRRHYAVGVTYLDEICITLQPLSLVFHGPILAALLGVFTLPPANQSSCQPTEENVLLSKSPEENWVNLPVLTSRNMPLMHVDVKEFSLFFPNLSETDNCSDAIDDVCVLRVGMLRVIPHPENPLPRLVMEKNVYRSALHAGITSCPGSEVEDRQYQLDVSDLEICSSLWDDLVNCGRRLQKFTQSANIQNPAFEWNTVSMSGAADEVRIFPLMAGSDLRVVFAPAMVFGSAADQLQVVCGYSVEVNATSDLEIFLTVDQIRLLCRVLDSNLNTTWRTDDQSCLSQDSVYSTGNNQSAGSEGNNPFGQLLNCTPFDVLLTGSKISIMLYSHEIVKDQQQTEDILRAAMNHDVSTSAASYRVLPFLFGLFSQPHLIVTCHAMSQKIEMSCYDVTVNGSGQDMSAVAENNRIVPVYSDFATRWMETKPGKPDSNTGILTSFCTVALTNYLTNSANLEICIGRPLKILISSRKVKQIIDFMAKINRALGFDDGKVTGKTSTGNDGLHKPTDAKNEMLESIRSGNIAWLNCVFISTVQLVAVVEFSSDDVRQVAPEQSSAILVSLSSIRADLRSLFTETDQLHRVVLDLVLNDVFVKTGLNGSFTQLLGPTSPSFTMTMAMMNCAGFPEWHRFIAFLRCENIPLHFAPENMLSIEQTQELLAKWSLTEMTNEELPIKQQQLDVSGREPDVVVTDQDESISFKSVPISETYDDLKAEFFNYLTVETRQSVPNPGEILFFADKDAAQAMMTWRYYEPRVLTNVKAMQVPFSIQRHHSAAAFDETIRVPCVLQFSLSLGETFEDYSEFFLSQNQSSQAELPDVANSNGSYVVAAEIWRVVMNMPPSDHQHLSEEMELLVSPLTLAASLRVDSRFVTELLPVFYVTSQIDCIQLRIFNQPSHLEKVESVLLSPFRLVNDVPKRESFLISVENLLLMAASSGAQCSWLHHLQMKTLLSCDVLEYRSLTLLSLLDRCSLSSEITLKLSAKPRLQVDVQLDKMFVRMSQSVVQTLSDVVQSWQNLHSLKPQLMAFLVICNNTLEELHFGQVETDEDLVLPSREAVPYSWRSTKARQLLRITLKSQQPALASSSVGSSVGSARDVDVLQEGIFCTTAASATGQDTMLIIKVSKLSSTVKQVVISGLVFFTNQLDRLLQIKILTKNSTKDATVVVAPGSRSASCVVDIADMRAIRLNVTTSAKTGWSQEIVISYAQIGLLAKVPLTNPAECIYVWCHVIAQNHSAVTETMIVFCPLFVVKSHFPSQLLMNVQTPKLKAVTQLELEGRGLERQLDVAGRDLIHNITFQINSTTQASTPPLTLSADTIEQVDRVSLADTDISKLSWLWHSSAVDDSWPYNSTDDITPSMSQFMSQKDAERMTDKTDLSSLPSSVYALDSSSVLNSEDQPNIELQVNLSQFWPGLNTLLINVLPHWLFVNESGLDAVLMEADSKSYKLPSRRTVAPPVFKGSFRIGVILGGRIHLSDFVELSDEERNTNYLYPTDGLFYLDGHLQIRIPVCHDDILVQHCFLSLHSTYKHNMRVVTVRERFQFVNQTPFDLQLYITTIESAKDRKVFVPDDPHASLVVRGKKEPTGQAEQTQSLLLWNVLQASESRNNPNAEYLPHVRFRYLDSKPNSSGTGDIFSLPWSYPVQLSFSASTGTRHSIALPCFDGAYAMTRPCVLTAVVLSEVVYLVLEEELYPGIELVNNCDVMLFFGQSVSTAPAQAVMVQEQLGVISNLPFVRPHSSCHYTLPLVNSLFPEIHENLQSAKLHVGALNSKQELIWSQALDIHADQSIFVVISKVSDLKVDIKRLGQTIRVRLNPVSRAEVSAKEIRSRIKGKSVVTVEEVGKPHRKKSVSRTVSEPTADMKEVFMDVRQDSVASEIPRDEKISNPLQIELSCFCREVSVMLFEELPSTELAPFLCVTLDEIGVLVHPKVDIAQAELSGTQELFICVYDLQVDNSSFATGFYDFPVVLKRSESLKSSSEDRCVQNLKERIKLLHGGAMISLSAELFHDKTFNTTSLQTLKIAVEPLLLFVEDTYCWNLLKIVDKLVPFSFLSDSGNRSSSQTLPLSVRIAAGALASPLRLRHLCIDPISVQLSVHASLKLFISSDRAPLSFSRFERKNVCTNSQQLFRALAMHYAVSAIYRAALVFGSLEILGNPTGFVRSIGNGVADLIRLPYDGLTKGPGPCITGLSGGMKSVARHFSAGTLTSITNFASSISRNMERLSMDDEHIQRNELTRRRRPSGLSEGLLSGLSGFGLSLLGAIAGVADQPLQTFTRSDMASYSTSDKAKGVVSGFGKGLIGMVAKPLGGAAEFVSQTSLGLLQGIGLVDACQPRHDDSGTTTTARIKAGSAKYHEKVLHLSSSDEILCYVHGCHVTSRTVTCTCALVLTSGCFYVVSEETEELLCTFPVADISLRKRESSDGALRLILRSGEELNELNQQTNSSRLAAFIDDTTALSSVEDRKFPLTSAVNCDSIETKYEFCFDRRTMDALIAWFMVAKNKNRRDSFPV